MRLRPRQTARQTASRLLPRLAQEFFEAGDELVNGAGGPERVHPFRILTKRFRYALEYFEPCYGAAMGSHLKTIKGLQQALGEVTDCYSTRVLLDRVVRLTKNRRYQDLQQALERREVERLAQFQALWREPFQNASIRGKLLHYLARPLPGRVRKDGKKAPRHARRRRNKGEG